MGGGQERDAGRARAGVIGFADVPLKLRKIISELGIRVGRGNSKAASGTHRLSRFVSRVIIW
jgi:hypothetical protein